jgi:hypothetical protein
MLSNVYRKKEELFDKIMLLELKPDCCTEVPLETIAKDDIVLFRDAIKSSDTIDDVSIWYWLMEKIVRYFISVKLSLLSQVSFDEVKDDLIKLGDISSEAIRLNRIITRASKSTNATISEIIEALRSLNSFVELLGFPNVVDEKQILTLLNKFNPELKTIINPKPKNIEYEILNERYKIVLNIEKSNAVLKDYIMHPRHQITESLVAFEAQKDR